MNRIDGRALASAPQLLDEYKLAQDAHPWRPGAAGILPAVRPTVLPRHADGKARQANSAPSGCERGNDRGSDDNDDDGEETAMRVAIRASAATGMRKAGTTIATTMRPMTEKRQEKPGQAHAQGQGCRTRWRDRPGSAAFDLADDGEKKPKHRAPQAEIG